MVAPDPSLRRRLADSPLLTLDEFSALRQFAGLQLPSQSETTSYHIDLLRALAATLCGTFDDALRVKSRRGANVGGYRAELALTSFAFAATLTAHSAENTELVGDPNGGYLANIIDSRHPSLSAPLVAVMEGGDRLAVGARTSRTVLELIERNRMKTKLDALELTMAIPTVARIAIETASEVIGSPMGALLAPLRG